MARSYPLYDDLLKTINERNEKSIDVKKVCSTIGNISATMKADQADEHYYEIGFLILHYEALNNNGVLLSATPFDGKIMVGGKGILNWFFNLPPVLQQIIAQYIEDYATNGKYQIKKKPEPLKLSIIHK